MELRDPRPAPLSGRLAALPRLALLAGPAVLAFFSGGYFESARLVAAIVAWLTLGVAALLVRHPLPRSAPARCALGGLAALTGWTLLSADWAPLAGPAGDAAQRCALYLGALAAGILAWQGARRWGQAVEPLLSLGMLVVVGYGMAGRLLPGMVHLHHSISAGGRLDQPLTYWNAMGALAAIGVVVCVRMAGDPGRPRVLRCAAAAAVPLLLCGLYVTFSRGALGAAGCGLLVLGLLAPTWAQLRAAAITLETGAAAVLVLSQLDGVASLSGSLHHQETQGALMLVVLAALMLLAAAVQAYACRVERERAVRLGPIELRPWGRRALALAAVAVAAAPFVAAVATERGSAAEATPAFGATAARFGSVGSNRYAYWRVAVRTAVHHPLRGTGAGSFRVGWLRERPFPEPVQDAHSLELQTLAELGLVGFAALAALLGGVAWGVRRAWRLEPRLIAGPGAALATWAVHSGIDWDWEMPALTLVAVVLAGFVLARSAPPPPRSAPPPRAR